MDNVYQAMQERTDTNKFVIGDLLFAELTCVEAEKSIELWSPVDHIVYVTSGKKSWRSSTGTVTATAGQAVFLSKGARIVEQFFDENFCFMLFFITDDFIREVISDLGEFDITPHSQKVESFSEIKLNIDTALTSYFHSMDEYFSAAEKPHPSLIRMKIKELIASIVVSDGNKGLSGYLQTVAHSRVPALKETMERNFQKNLTISEFAALCHRSVSSFKRDFHEQYDSPPGRWLLEKRLEYSMTLLRGTEKSISAIVLECGFVDMSHYSKSFKNKFGVTPSTFRKSSNF